MKHYAVLYIKAAKHPFSDNPQSTYLINMCGDRSHYLLDGRNNLSTQISDGREWAIKHGARGFRIETGANLLDLQPKTEMFWI